MEQFSRRLSQYVSAADVVTDAISGLDASQRQYASGRDIISSGQETGHIFIVLEGWAIRYRTVQDGRRQIVNFMLPGDIFDLHALGDLKADHSVAALDRLTAQFFKADDFLDILRREPVVATAFWWAAVQEESILREQILRIGRLSARERIGQLLLELQQRLDAVQGTQGTPLRMPVTRADIADALGLTPVHVSRTLTALKRMGLIEEARASLSILDRAELARLSQFDPDYLHIRRLELGEGPGGNGS